MKKIGLRHPVHIFRITCPIALHKNNPNNFSLCINTSKSNSIRLMKKRLLDEKPVPGKTHDSYDSVTRQYSYNLQPEVNELLREFRTGYF